jgi:beta-glucanase (GH16 family)
MMRILLLLLALSPAVAQKLIWHDEFNGRAGSAPDRTRWNYDAGAGKWGNYELETYTDSAGNAFLDGNGHLVIRVLKTADGYTSARLKTEGKFEFTYGKVEARLRLPQGQGIWPAFWMLPLDRSLRWPNAGEIDIMENIGREPGIVHATVHGPGYSGDKGITSTYQLDKPDAFHIYTVEWRRDSIEFQVDRAVIHKATPANLPAGARWVFTSPFFLLLNVAVGGTWPGNPDATTTFPQTMVVDWVRVYRLRDYGPQRK